MSQTLSPSELQPRILHNFNQSNFRNLLANIGGGHLGTFAKIG